MSVAFDQHAIPKCRLSFAIPAGTLVLVYQLAIRMASIPGLCSGTLDCQMPPHMWTVRLAAFGNIAFIHSTLIVKLSKCICTSEVEQVRMGLWMGLRQS